MSVPSCSMDLPVTNGNALMCESQSAGVIRLYVAAENVMCRLQMPDSEQTSDTVTIATLPWRLTATCDSENASHIAIFTECFDKCQTKLWSCSAVVTISLINWADPSKSIVRSDENADVYNQKQTSWGHVAFAAWNEFLDPKLGFVVNDTLTFEAKVNIIAHKGIRLCGRLDFASDTMFSDVVLLVDNRRFHVNKMYLSMHSEVFHSMFNGSFRECGQQEVTLKDVDADSFELLLNLIYPQRIPLNTSSVEQVLELANRFQMSRVMSECEQFLLSLSPNDHSLSFNTKFCLADRYNLVLLHDWCLRSMQSIAALLEHRQSEDFELLSDATKDSLYDKVMDMVKADSEPVMND